MAKTNKKSGSKKTDNWLDSDNLDTIENSSTKKTTTVEKSSSSVSSITATLASLFALVAIAGNGYLYLEMQKKEKVIKNSLHQVENQQEINQQQIIKLQGRNPNEWKAAEALYLLKIADRKLNLEDDPDTALSLAKASKKLVDSVQDPSFSSVSDSISRDIIFLEHVEANPTHQAIYKINALLDKVDALQILTIEQTERKNKPAATFEADSFLNNETSLADQIRKAWKELFNNIVTVRDHGDQSPEFIGPEQAWYLKENIRQRLLTAQLAVYRLEYKSYKESLQHVQTWLMRYSDLEQPETKNFLNTLLDLEVIKFSKSTQHNLSSIKKLETVFSFQGNDDIKELTP